MPGLPTTALVSEAGVYGKVAWRIIPLLFVCYIAAYLDRVNVSFAKLQMQADVPAISETVFGLGTGIFFLGYFVFEVPSNIINEPTGIMAYLQFTKEDIMQGVELAVMALLSLIVVLTVVRPLVRRRAGRGLQCTAPTVTVSSAGLPLDTGPAWLTPPSGVTSSYGKA